MSYRHNPYYCQNSALPHNFKTYNYEIIKGIDDEMVKLHITKLGNYNYTNFAQSFY